MTTRVVVPTPKRRIAAANVIRRLPHEAETLRGVGYVAQHVDELRARDVALLEVRAARNDLVGDLRVGDQMRGAVEHQHVRVGEMVRQPVGFHQEFRMDKAGCAHVSPPPLAVCVERTASPSVILATGWPQGRPFGRPGQAGERKQGWGFAPDPTKGHCPLEPRQGRSPWNP